MTMIRQMIKGIVMGIFIYILVVAVVNSEAFVEWVKIPPKENCDDGLDYCDDILDGLDYCLKTRRELEDESFKLNEKIYYLERNDPPTTISGQPYMFTISGQTYMFETGLLLSDDGTEVQCDKECGQECRMDEWTFWDCLNDCCPVGGEDE